MEERAAVHPAAGARASRARRGCREHVQRASKQASQTASRTRPASVRGAPTDAQVRRELEQAFGSRAGRAIDAAGLGSGGLATVPPAAPARVAAIINAGNSVARKPYVYGGGHGRLAGETFVDSAYDCSGSVSFALAAAGLVDSPMDSSALARFGRAGPGRWVTIYANAGHAFMTVAGLRFDTSGATPAARAGRWRRGRSAASRFATPRASEKRDAPPRRARRGVGYSVGVWLVA